MNGEMDMEGHEVDAQGAPIYTGSGEKIKTLRRRVRQLQAQLDDWNPGKRGEDFARAEVAALRAAVSAMVYHRAEMQGLPTVVTALEELVRAVCGDAVAGVDPMDLPNALERARAVLTEWKAV